MKIYKNGLLKFIGSFLLLGLFQTNMNACSCDTISYKAALEYADEIFVGKIVKAEKFENGRFINAENKEEISWDWRYYFEVQKKWKGIEQPTLVIHHHGSSCDYWFDIYERTYLVYASRSREKEIPLGVTLGRNKEKPELNTWLCSRTIANRYREKNWFDGDIEKLDKDFPNKIILAKPLNSNWILLGGIGFLTLILLIFPKLKH